MQHQCILRMRRLSDPYSKQLTAVHLVSMSMDSKTGSRFMRGFCLLGFSRLFTPPLEKNHGCKMPYICMFSLWHVSSVGNALGLIQQACEFESLRNGFLVSWTRKSIHIHIHFHIALWLN